MKSTVEKQDKHVVSIQLEIDANHATQEYNKACKRLSQRVNVPGFRRGKAPRNVIEKTVGIERIKQDVVDRLLPSALADVISEHQLDIVASPMVENWKFELGESISVKAQVETRPEVKLPELTGIEVTVPRYESPEGAMEQELFSIQQRMTTLETVIDRPAEANDIVNLDFTGTANGELIRGGSAKNYRLDLAENNFIEGFGEQVPGHRIGEEFTIQVTFPKEYHDPSLAGKPAEFALKINEIKKRVVPQLTDDLAKKIGNFQSAEDLKKSVAEFIQKNEEQENGYRTQKAVVDWVVAGAEVDIPDAMINREAKILMEEVQQRFKHQGLSWEQFLDSEGHEKIWKNLREEATQRIRTSLVLGAVAKQEGIVVNDDEFTAHVQEMAKLRNQDEKMIMRQLANNLDAAQALSDQILSVKVVDLLKSRAKITLIEDPEKGKPAGSAVSQAVAATAAAGPGNEDFEVLADE